MKLKLLVGFMLMASAFLAWAVLAEDERDRLCVNGHPRHRAPGVTYGGKVVIPGYERDHIVPLGLGGADTASNVQYQACYAWGPRGCAEGPAADSDKVEILAIKSFCWGKLSLSAARRMVADQKGK